MKKLAEVLHALLCEKPHVEHMVVLLEPRRDTHCYWEVEENVAESDVELRLDHKFWEDEANKLCQALGQTEAQAIRTVYAILESRRLLAPIMAKDTKIRDLVLRILTTGLDEL